jgi:branched-chain amino acid transport system substrate-binding protein
MLRYRVVVVAIATLGLVAGCSSSSQSSGAGGASGGDAPIQVLVSAPIGVAGTLGIDAEMVEMSVKASASVINKAGGVNGHKIEITTVDDLGDPTTAVTKLEQAISSNHKPLVWISAGPSNITAAALPILNQNKILSFDQGATADSGNPVKYPYNFDITPSDANLARPICSYAKSLNVGSVAVLYADDASDEVSGPAIQNYCKSDGMTVTGAAEYDPTALNMTPELEQLKSGNPQALVIEGFGAPVGYILKDLSVMGWKPPHIIGDLAVAITNLIYTPPPTGLLGTAELANVNVETLGSTVYQPSSDETSAFKAMLSAFKQEGSIPGPLILAYQYDSLQMFAAAAKQAGTVTDVAAIAKAMGHLKPGSAQTGVFARYNYSPTSHSPNVADNEFAFPKPSTLIDGQYDAPGSGG